MEYYAHSIEGKPGSSWQLLEDHLKSTAKHASKMAGEFGCSEWGYLIGLWHDLGKFSPEFQRRIQSDDPDPVDHSTAGAIWASQRFHTAGRILAYSIAGHHAGLPDYQSNNTGRATLSQRLLHEELLASILHRAIPEILSAPLPTQEPPPFADPAFWIRLLFSCMVDADFLDTEAFMEPGKAAARGNYQSLPDLLTAFSSYMQKKQSDAPNTGVNQIRRAVLEQCIRKADGPSGIYTLTVPTGGGKTLSSMAFALKHAVTHSKRRIIYVIPYTSIIEQTADQFREIFGDAVIEHQSNLDVSDERKDNTKSRLACENWDAPIVVTTSVQFFESLFASRTSRCRKLHNIVNTIVIIDEAQLLPPEFLEPILNVLRELSKNYGVTLLLSTATQPALGPHQSSDFKFAGLPDMTEIMEDSAGLHNQLKRVEIIVPPDLNEPRNWDDLAQELGKYPSALCIVNRRDDCRELWNRLPKGTFHLSGLMCGAHRSQKIEVIRQRLRNGIPTRVVSTQLVEAGVDLDFPVVYRALAGLDSIAQAAGRCNREGLLQEKGRVIVFVPPSSIPVGHLRQAAQIGQRLLSQECPDILAPDRFEQFFREFYWIQGERLDKHLIMIDLQTNKNTELRYSFRTAAEKFRLIDDSKQAPIIVRYGDGINMIKKLKQEKPDRDLLRELQRYVVNLPRCIHSKLLGEGDIQEVETCPGIYIQVNPSMYDEDIGFCPDKSVVQPDELII